MRVIVTRPEHDALTWVADLRARGVDAVALPLIRIALAADPQPVQAAWRQLGRYTAVMFVSGNAVKQFFEANRSVVPVEWTPDAINTRAWATGPGTAHALRKAGVAADSIDAPPADAGQFDSEALWQVVQGQVRRGDRVLLVRGAGADGQTAGRDWLARTLGDAGAQVDTVQAYARCTALLDSAQLALARDAASDGSVWLFSSSEAIGGLATLLPGLDWSGARAIATHPRIAQAARQAGFGVVCESRPTLADVMASIESIG